jgi:hypothetical protein
MLSFVFISLGPKLIILRRAYGISKAIVVDFKAKEPDFKPSCHYSLKYKS